MATYNGEKYIKEQLDSILSQLSSQDEVIISDDGSTDDTLKIIMNYNDERIKIFHHQSKINPIYNFSKVGNVMYNFENAIKQASGDVIFLSDQDDIWCKEKVNICIKELKTNDLVLSNFSLIDKDGNYIKEKVYEKNPYSKSNFINLKTLPFVGCTMAFKKEALAKVFPFPDSVWLHDLWIGLVINKYGKVSYIETPTILHRLTDNNTSSVGKNKSKNSLYIKLKYRFYNYVNVLLR